MAKTKKSTTPVVKKDTVEKIYEIMFILEPGMQKKAHDDSLNAVKKIISSNEGNIHFDGDLGSHTHESYDPVNIVCNENQVICNNNEVVMNL